MRELIWWWRGMVMPEKILACLLLASAFATSLCLAAMAYDLAFRPMVTIVEVDGAVYAVTAKGGITRHWNGRD